MHRETMNHKWLYQCLVLFQINCVCLGNQQPEVETPLGHIRGECRFALRGKRYCAFEGIPYAQPPVGHLRFENPLPVKPWEGVFTATQPTTCLQLIGGLDGDEDCLHLNVYTPCEKNDTNRLYDVIVYIHGGGFSIGSGKSLNATYMMDLDRIVVSINFRLGIFGFLSMEDEILPGNYGLKDQVMALQWVQQYIPYFHGNKESVTLAGISAGGASVHLHYLSPLSKGLFNRGISHGGSALMPFVLMENPSANAIKMADYVGCPIQPTIELKECLKNKSAEMMTLSSIIYLAYNVFPTSPFAPVIENCTDAFLPAHPYELLNSGNISDIPWIVSSTTNEGIILTGNFYDNMNEIDKNWVDLAPYILEYYNTIPESRKVEVATKIKDYYLGSGGHFSMENFNIFTEKKRLAAIGGATVRNSVMGMLKFLLSNEVAMKFNWAGRDKRPFKTTNMMKVVREAVRYSYRGSDEQDLKDKVIEESVKDWLKLAKARYGYSLSRKN